MQKKAISPHPVDIHVGGMIRQFRVGAGLSQTELGNSLGISFQQVQKYEKGSNRVSSSKLFEIATLLNHDLEDFFSGLSRQTQTTSDKEVKQMHSLSSTAIKIGHHWERIQDIDTRKWLSKLVVSLSKESAA